MSSSSSASLPSLSSAVPVACPVAVGLELALSWPQGRGYIGLFESAAHTCRGEPGNVDNEVVVVPVKSGCVQVQTDVVFPSLGWPSLLRYPSVWLIFLGPFRR